MTKPDYMTYLPYQEQTGSDVMDIILRAREKADFSRFTERDVRAALANSERGLEDFAALLSPAAAPLLEEMAQEAAREKERHFGKNIYLFTPLYIANFCDNHCVYCGYNVKNDIRRARLSEAEIERECATIAKSGLREILILTGESETQSPLEYIGAACKIARKYFPNVGVEIYPLNTAGYAFLHECGADFVTVFQETYNPEKYAKLHLAGNKRIFPYRLNAQERALKGGMRGVAFAALLGLDDWRADALCVGLHARELQRRYPHAEISISCPRLRPIVNNGKINPRDVGERELAQIICAYRLFLPYAGITLSTRENATFRDHALRFGVTKVSGGVSVGIGEHGARKKESEGDGQFEISDTRGVEEMREAIKKAGLTPVMNDYVFV